MPTTQKCCVNKNKTAGIDKNMNLDRLYIKKWKQNSEEELWKSVIPCNAAGSEFSKTVPRYS